jgi:ABC-2 type transport system permease protein
MKTETSLTIDQTRGWRLGLRNLLSRENSKWWKTSRWWIQTVVWGLITNGILVLLLFLMPLMVDLFPNVDQSQLNSLPGGVEMFFSMAGLAFPIGVVILVQGSIINEKEWGTAEWILSKPVSRTAFILSKFLSHALGILITLILFQSAFAYVLIWLNQGAPIPPWQFLKGVGVLIIMLLFYLSLVLMMEVLSDKRGTVLAVGLGSALGGMLLVQLFPFLVYITPFALANLAPMIVLGSSTANIPVWLPVISTLIMSVVFLTIAIKQFNQKAL